MAVNYSKKKMIVADVDGTMTKSKQPMDEEMSEILNQLLASREFAVIGGGKYKQFQDQFASRLKADPKRLLHLHLFPTCGACYYRFQEGEWKQVYAENLSADEKKRIYNAFDKTLKETGFKKAEPIYGELLEDRGTSIAFSALGQEAPISAKESWDPDQKKRLALKVVLEKYIPDFEILLVGMTTIDILRKGIDKAYGIRKMQKHLGYKIEEMLFIGDALYEGGNDETAKKTGIECVQVSGPEETKKILQEIIQTPLR